MNLNEILSSLSPCYKSKSQITEKYHIFFPFLVTFFPFFDIYSVRICLRIEPGARPNFDLQNL